jgi:ParB-like chromosome segregation protein Spo0J
MAQTNDEGVTWESHVVGFDVVAPAEILRNPNNFRRHPEVQRAALRGSLNELGMIAPVIINRTTGHLLDGEARLDEYEAAGVPAVPVVYVEIPPEKEGLALLSLDPIAAMAEVDRQQLAKLLEAAATTEQGLADMLAVMAEREGIVPPDFDSVSVGDEGRLDQKTKVVCPECGHEFTP